MNEVPLRQSVGRRLPVPGWSRWTAALVVHRPGYLGVLSGSSHPDSERTRHLGVRHSRYTRAGRNNRATPLVPYAELESAW